MVMIRLSAILLLFVYAFSATGASVYLHYCCGEARYMAIQEDIPTNADDCPLCVTHHEPPKTEDRGVDPGCHQPTTTNDQCYSVKVELKKTTEEHLASSDKNNLPKTYPLELIAFSLIGIADFPWSQPVVHLHDEQVAHPPGVPLFVQYCTYLI